jgi:hypothetical protein
MFLRQIAERDPEAHHVVIWDNAGFHQRPGDGTLPANVRLLPLPAYSPELNPVEKLWEIVRDRVANKVHGTITAMDDAVARVLRDMYHAPDMIRSLVGTGWMHLQANASSKTFSINTFGQWYKYLSLSCSGSKPALYKCHKKSISWWTRATAACC